MLKPPSKTTVAAIALVAILPMTKAACTTNSGPAGSTGIYTGFPQAAVQGKVKPSGVGVRGHTGWVGDEPPGGSGGWKELGFVKKGPYQGEIVWKRR